jgi:hypothetical protein
MKLTRTEIANLMHLSAPRIDQLRAEGTLPKDLELVSTLRAAVRHLAHRADLNELRRAHLEKRTALLDHQLEERQRRLVRIDHVEKLWCGVTSALRAGIIASDVDEATKESLCRTLREIPIEQYLPAEDQRCGEADELVGG